MHLEGSLRISCRRLLLFSMIFSILLSKNLALSRFHNFRSGIKHTRVLNLSSNTCPAMLSDDEVLKGVRQIVPTLHHGLHKGQCGRIGIIGGSEEYTGAPYFAAITALKVGADLAHVFCSRSAAPVIKSYSPELIVHPILDDKDVNAKMQRWISNLHAVVIGPGLGRDEGIMNSTLSIIEELKKQNKPLVIDADGLFLVTNNLDSVRGYKNTILTPNQVEFKRLKDALNISEQKDEIEEAVAVSKELGDLTVLRKCHHDIIATGDKVLVVNAEGSPRRCGGQGDLLSGSAAVFFYWALNHNSLNKETAVSPNLVEEYGAGSISAHAAGLLSKLCAKRAFAKYKRSTTTSDLIEEINSVFDETFETNLSPKM